MPGIPLAGGGAESVAVGSAKVSTLESGCWAAFPCLYLSAGVTVLSGLIYSLLVQEIHFTEEVGIVFHCCSSW